MILIPCAAKFKASPTNTELKPHSPDRSPNTKPHSPDRKLPLQQLLRPRRHHQSLPQPPEPKPAPWISLPTVVACHQKNELAGWLKAAATDVAELAIWLGNAPSDKHSP